MMHLFLTVLLGAWVPDPCAALLPLDSGRSWIYAGSAVWGAPAPGRADSSTVRWTMAVERARDVPGGRVGLIRGFVQELAWYQPGTVPRLSILACSGAELRLATFADDPAAQGAYDHWSDSLTSRAELWIALPLREGQLLAQEPPRPDAMYGWLVERAQSPVPIPDSCPLNAGPRYELTYRSLPDHRIAEWQPGVGITRFGYGHHGSVASTDVRLVECRARGEG